MMDPELRELAKKYEARLLLDPLFSFRVKTIFRMLQVVADREKQTINNLRVQAYMLACVLEESHGHPGETQWQR